ncbi:glutamine synthetase III [Gordonibacter urolithinfaciens]|uniref:Glutamine synthetase type III n=1 Tax=Gordonibacter urolithinfaciens TaxID=1335613 RepID=A0A6N8IEE1_9ACTN|nr:glutamine synthetase III [Gordonibacter urolithinfaciens]MVM53422.1 glutamine synthetase type III [Gordonibacter urolithinfaciens]MVN13820.1 glutamine synthetase type III [Gordonibacter urolithinfaciens]MVN37368.1 glutamine synthetase type III [Gordonibacter urolithinfaciens]MVN54704.1 glutamine synthetase type III [Gordonibacter urolithinfaciens]MVN59990.1 glutamine synthetase type III [Gordonibacter urolithinfaciens]
MARVSDTYGSMVFNEHTMQERLPSATYKSLLKTMKQGEPLEIEVANVVAHAMKEWAIEKGATHFTHWFQPLSGITSEKHDSFLDPVSDGRAIMSFSGKELISGESDASSFPSGGLRATFEARGYTAWDPTSYAFVKDEVLCIPTAFCSYTGEALDKKTPLLRSMSAVEEQANRVLALFGWEPQRVVPTVGAEQEYFLISEKDYAKRQDLVMCGRTLFGYAPCKGQELEEHYFGAIRPTVNEFMKELDDELWALGVPARTKHNEVAPAQHELAPIFTNANRGVDENLLTMEKMRLLASHYGLVCLLHEKPFEGINGSGKHNNWSLSASKNLFDPGESPMDNLRFLVFLTAVIQAVDDYQELLRMSVASAGNDHRLGADEAPPAIVSIFLGDELDAIVDALVDDHEYESAEKVAMDLGVDVLPNFLKDNTDRNRTSPFAFTGNKFEFRMPGSNVNLSDANMILNTAVAKSFKDFADAMEGKEGDEFETATIAYIRKTLKAHRRIIFNGNGYAEEWEREAERRGLANHRTTADALPCFVDPKSIALFEELGVLSEAEVRSRYEVKLEKYNKLLNIEARTMKRMVRRAYLPAINGYAAEVARGITAVRAAAAGAEVGQQEALLRKLLAGVKEIDAQLQALDAAHHAALELVDQQQRANKYAHEIVPIMEKLRAAVDEMEIVTDRDHWPVPTYNDMLFYV